MKIADFEINIIRLGEFRLDGGAMFGVIPKVMWEKQFPADEKNRITMALNSLLLISPERKILIDSGVGTKFSEKYLKIYGVDHSKYNLIKSLQEQKVQPDEITDVILTHLHFDHVGGCTKFDSSGKIVLQFPNAKHYVQRKQLEWSQKGFEKDRASYLAENIDPLINSGKLIILDGEDFPIPNIQLMLANGHTEAQQMVLISDRENKLLYAADLIPTSAHVPLPWIMAYDLSPMKTLEEKKIVLKRAVEENWMIFFEHDPHISCARITETDKGFQVEKKINI